MKSNLSNFFVKIAFFFIIVSCSSEENLNQSAEFSQIQIENVFKYRGEAQRNAFILLDDNLKYEVWKTKLSNDLNDKIFSKEQERSITNLLGFLKPSHFSTSNNANETDKDLSKWIDDAKLIFDRNELRGTFAELNDQDEDLPPDDSGNSASNCTCSIPEDLCRFGSNCERANCKRKPKGCGLLWNTYCDGKCF
ncbi:MAG: hypothetical protein CVU07_11850 [Bacteroidetes bacterium HGW-Bacteroidetes-23]|nr:MAG: hypothetical protein CVU07_11850 [Bacteroidetes bacterium HGW-Bacteroidetes-23]